MNKPIGHCIVDVKMTLSERDLLEGLAEEACEVGKAALKLIRAKGMGENWTPVTEKEAEDSLMEELTDVLAYLVTLDISLPDLDEEKFNRWSHRVLNKKDMEVNE